MDQEFDFQEDGELLTPAEAAEYLSVSRYIFLQISKNKKFPKPVKVSSRTLRWKKHEIVAWLGKKK